MRAEVITVRNVSHPRRRSAGFTLIEVMIVVAIIGILAAVALPAYNDYVRRGQIPEAFAQLSEYRARMEQYYQDNRNYGTVDKCAADSTADGWNGFTPGNAKYFGYGCKTVDAQQGYVITATGNAASAVGHVYKINQNGDRTTTKFKNADVTATCWLTKAAAC